MNQQEQIWKTHRETFPDETIYETSLVLMYEFGDLCKSLFYLKRRKDRIAYIGEVKKAIGDMTAQLRIICSELDLDYQELETLGYNAFMEHYKEFHERRTNT